MKLRTYGAIDYKSVYYDYFFLTLGSTMIPRDDRKLDRLQNTTKLAGMTCQLINKAVMKQNCIEASNQHAQPLEKEAVSPETSAIRRPRPLRNETAEQLIGPSESTAI